MLRHPVRVVQPQVARIGQAFVVEAAQLPVLLPAHLIHCVAEMSRGSPLMSATTVAYSWCF